MKQSVEYNSKWIITVLCFVLCARLLSMAVMPLNDKTEARYGEIARLMVAQDNWVTLFQAPQDPFLAKPPLSTWSSAFSMKVFGIHAWSARLPALFFSIGVLLLVGYLAKKHYGSRQLSQYAMLILAGSPYFLIDAGVVMTDPALLFSTTLCMTAGWFALTSTNKTYGYLFFVGIGLGLLAKGPLISVLVVLPLMLWSIQQRTYRLVWRQLPWVKGSLLSLAIALPWYIWAEIRTPGFLNYFIVGEHISRFLQSGWTGDKYGFAHATAYGMIWVYLLGGVLSWLILMLVGFFKKNRLHTCPQERCSMTETSNWLSYLLFFALTPLIFFTFSRNIIYTYTFSSLPALALIFTEGIHRGFLNWSLSRCAHIVAISGIVLCIVASLFFFKPEWIAKSQDRMISLWHQQLPSPNTSLIYWATQPDYSAQFYSKGHVIAVRDATLLAQLLKTSSAQYIAVKANELHEIPLSMRSQWVQVKTIQMQEKSMILFRQDLG